MTGNQSWAYQQDKAVQEYLMLLRSYMHEVEPTDTLLNDNFQPVLLGLFGEVGSIMAIEKKRHREPEAYSGYQQAVEEEFGDAFWYFAALCRRLHVGVDNVFSDTVARSKGNSVAAESGLLDGSYSLTSSSSSLSTLDDVLLKLGKAAAALLDINKLDDRTRGLLCAFLDSYMQALRESHVRLSKVVRMNTEKARGRFIDPVISDLPTFDSDFPDEERIPLHFEIKVIQRKAKQSHLQWNGVFIGDPLTDNIHDADGYRFHDVFHLAHAAILHWSPTFRALIKQKRKSVSEIDEAQDGGRAIVVEEGLTAWIFSRAKHLKLFDGQSSVSFDMLKTVEQFVQGYEVEQCPLKLWERAILEGYEVFRQVLANNGGIIAGDREARTITYRVD